MVTEYNATATTALRDPPARVLDFARLLPTLPPPLSEPRLPAQPTRWQPKIPLSAVQCFPVVGQVVPTQLRLM